MAFQDVSRKVCRGLYWFGIASAPEPWRNWQRSGLLPRRYGFDSLWFHGVWREGRAGDFESPGLGSIPSTPKTPKLIVLSRLTAGQRTLDPRVGVRIPGEQMPLQL